MNEMGVVMNRDQEEEEFAANPQDENGTAELQQGQKRKTRISFELHLSLLIEDLLMEMDDDNDG